MKDEIKDERILNFLGRLIRAVLLYSIEEASSKKKKKNKPIPWNKIFLEAQTTNAIFEMTKEVKREVSYYYKLGNQRFLVEYDKEKDLIIVKDAKDPKKVLFSVVRDLIEGSIQ